MAIRANLTAIVLAGGRGTRIAHLYPDTPKPLVPINGRPFLHWLTGYLLRNGVDKIVYSLGYRPEQFERFIEGQINLGRNITFKIESSPLGTGGAIFNCLPSDGDWILIINGDSLVAAYLTDLLTVRHEVRIEGGILGVEVNDASRYGTLRIGKDNLLEGFQEKRPGSGIINAGVYMFHRSVLEALRVTGKVSFEETIIPRMIERGTKIKVSVALNAPFIDIGTPESLAEASAFIAANQDWFQMP